MVRLGVTVHATTQMLIPGSRVPAVGAELH